MEWIDEIKQSLLGIESSLKSVLETYQKFSEFFDTFFTLFPPEVILLYVVLVLLLILLNSISPGTPRWNVALILVFYSGLWIYFNISLSGESRILHVFLTDLYVILPVYGFSILKFLYSIASRRIIKGDAANLRMQIREVKTALHSIDSLLDGKNPDRTVLAKDTEELKKRVAEFENLLRKGGA